MSRPSSAPSPLLLLLLLSAAALAATVVRGDPEPVQDFCVAAPRGSSNATASPSLAAFPGLPCKPASAVVSDDFFFAAHARAASTDNPAGAGVTPGNVEAFPGLNTLGLSLNRVDLAPGGVNPLHTHPRAAELVHVEEGEMLVGFVSTEGKFYSKVVRPGESFVIPRGMMHFQYNVGAAPARAMTVFNSQLPGVVLAAQSLFGAEPEVPDAVLAKSFQVDAEIIKLLKSKFRKG
jgi:quercetin dioxygenase-like cupin family protein